MHLLVSLGNLFLFPIISLIIAYRKKNQRMVLGIQIIADYFLLFSFCMTISLLVSVLMQGIMPIRIGVSSYHYTCIALITCVALPYLCTWLETDSQKLVVSKVENIVLKVVEAIMLMAIALISFYNQMELTMFQIPFTHDILWKLLKVMPIIVAIKAALIWKEKALWLSLPPALVLYFAFPREHYLYQAFFCFLIVGCVGIRIKKILCAAFIPATLVIFNMMIASLGGAITSLASAGRGIRSYWGHISPTDFGTAVLCIVVFVWVAFEDLPEEWFVLPSLFSLFISFYITHSYTSGLLTILFMAILLWRWLEKNIILKRSNLQWIIKFIDIFMRISFPLLGFIMVAAVFAYHKEIPFARVLNTLSHKRISVPAEMYALYGIKPFGTYFDMYGNGGSIIHMITDYTFIDSSYPQILIRYGWVTYIVANILWAYATNRAIKSGNRRLAMVMTLFAVDFVMEHHWYELCYNAFVIVPFADFGINGVREKTPIIAFRQRFEDKKYRISYLFTGIICNVILFLLLPIMFSYIRTVFNGYGLVGGGEVAKIIFVVATILVVLSVIIQVSICNVVASYIAKKKIASYSGILIAVSSLALLVLFVKADSMIKFLTSDLNDRVSSEKDMLEYIIENSEGKVYVDKLPEVYIRNGLKIDRAYYSGEDLARSSCATVVVDAPLDLGCFTSRGFLYLPISEDDAIYTNDDNVISALKNEGYVLKGYNSYVNSVDLNYTADIRGMEKTEDGGIILGNRNYSFSSLPKVDLTGGKYTATYNLRLENEPYDEDYKIGNISITSYDGGGEIASFGIMRSFFDDNGELQYKISFIGYGNNIEFRANVEGDNSFEIESIEYERTPDYDVHVKVDNRGRVIRAEYYDLDGNPKEMSGGYYGLETDYGKHDLPVMIRYLGDNFEPILLSSGYNAVRKEYNANRQVEIESYYDVDDSPILLPSGYHFCTREYDYSGNVTCEAYFGLSEEPVFLDDSYHKIVKKYDDKDRCVHEEYYGIDDKLVMISTGNCGVDREFDDDGNVIKQIFLGDDLKPIIATTGYAEVRKEYTSKKDVSKEEYFDANGNPIALVGGQASVEYEYDDFGNRIEEKFFDVENRPVLSYGKFAAVKRKYDEKKRCIHEEYYGTDENIIIQDDGSCGFERVFDDAGNVIKFTYIGTDFKAVINTSGYAIWRRIYNDKNQITREEYYDTEDKPIALPTGQASVEYEYDDDGNRIKESFFDVENKSVLCDGRIAVIRRRFDDKKQSIHEDYLGPDGAPAVQADGSCGFDRVFDDAGNIIEYTYIGTDFKAIMNVYGYATWRRIYNDKKQITREEYFDATGQPIALLSGQTTVEYEYDENGNCIAASFYDESGGPIIRTEGYQRVEYIYGEGNKLIKTIYKDAAGNVVEEKPEDQ